MTLAIDIAIEHDDWAALGDLQVLADRAIAAAIQASGVSVPAEVELSVVLCDDDFIRGLNARWRGLDKATNVLSFPSDMPRMLGDIVVAYETSAREAVDEGRSLSDHLAHLLIHGCFHLVGFDHAVDADADTMESLEARALAMLGIASPYADMARS